MTPSGFFHFMAGVCCLASFECAKKKHWAGASLFALWTAYLMVVAK
jgi:hypothetical protein